ncbi:MAG: hypothetical protein M3Z50_10915 [Actinomycetota bacterium]|nr:hypothetical protein [Actinomycetota bacterium]
MTDPLLEEYSPAGYPAGDPEPQGTADVAKDQAANVGKGAADAGQHVAGVAKDQAQNVVAEAGNQAKNLLGQAQTELNAQAGAQQQRLAGGLHSLGDQLQSMAQGAEPGMVTDLARQGSSKTHEIGSWLESREPSHLLDELQSLARRRPGAFLLAAAGAGLLAGRLTRGVKDAGSDSSGNSSSFSPVSDPTLVAEPYVVPETPGGFPSGGGGR